MDTGEYMGFLKCLKKFFTKEKVWKEEETREELQKGNPYLPYIRRIVEQILARKGLDYGGMKLLLIDKDEEEESLFEEDKADMVLKQMSPDLNFLIIVTNRPAYFQEYVEKMYEETGLIVRVEEKDASLKYGANLVLDLEPQGDMYEFLLEEPKIYLPIYKRGWKTAENLDIYVPIGYNTVIVKGFV